MRCYARDESMDPVTLVQRTRSAGDRPSGQAKRQRLGGGNGGDRDRRTTERRSVRRRILRVAGMVGLLRIAAEQGPDCHSMRPDPQWAGSTGYL
jgi:hypothetical protein